MSELKSAPALGNPAVVGLGGFGLTTIILQLHNLGLCGIGPVIACGLVFGGLAQFIAGFGEQKVGNNFGYAAFTAYGAFWIALCIILLFNKFGNGLEVLVYFEMFVYISQPLRSLAQQVQYRYNLACLP